jgi:hypothetical protein
MSILITSISQTQRLPGYIALHAMVVWCDSRHAIPGGTRKTGRQIPLSRRLSEPGGYLSKQKWLFEQVIKVTSDQRRLWG